MVSAKRSHLGTDAASIQYGGQHAFRRLMLPETLLWNLKLILTSAWRTLSFSIFFFSALVVHRLFKDLLLQIMFLLYLLILLNRQELLHDLWNLKQ